jgi:centractin
VRLVRDITDNLQLLLRKSGHYLHTSAEKEVVRTIKEKTCYIAPNLAREDKEMLGRTEEFRLPDGKVIQVGRSVFGRGERSRQTDWLGIPFCQLGSERYWAPEILFNPELIGMEDPGVHQVSWNSMIHTELSRLTALVSVGYCRFLEPDRPRSAEKPLR